MAQNTHIKLAADTWTLLTDSDVTNITFQNVSQNYFWISATVGATAPSSIAGAVRYDFGEGEANVALSTLFPGVSGANRVYALAGDEAGGTGAVMVSHA